MRCQEYVTRLGNRKQQCIAIAPHISWVPKKNPSKARILRLRVPTLLHLKLESLPYPKTQFNLVEVHPTLVEPTYTKASRQLELLKIETKSISEEMRVRQQTRHGTQSFCFVRNR